MNQNKISSILLLLLLLTACNQEQQTTETKTETKANTDQQAQRRMQGSALEKGNLVMSSIRKPRKGGKDGEATKGRV